MDEYMITALEEALTGAREGGIPIGAVLVNTRGTVVATGRNRPLQEGTCVMHAEINCLLNAGQRLSSFRGMTMYSTLIPCNNVRRSHRALRHHQGGVRGVRKLPGGQRSRVPYAYSVWLRRANVFLEDIRYKQTEPH